MHILGRRMLIRVPLEFRVYARKLTIMINEL
jgi:hypothetical protein